MGHDPSTIRAFKTHLHRRSSRIERWVEEQHTITSDVEEEELGGVPTVCHPYLAYPHLSVPSLLIQDDKSSTGGDGFLDQPATKMAKRVSDAKSSSTPGNEPSTPSKGSPARQIPNASRPTSPLRGLQLPFGSRRHLNSVPDVPRVHSPASSALSRQDPSNRHARDPSISTTYSQPRVFSLDTPPRQQPPWKMKRRAVMGHFASPSDTERASDAYPPRPSTSSSVTQSSTTTQTRTSLDTPTTPRKWDLGSVRGHPPSVFLNSASSLWSLPVDATHLNDPPDSTKVLAQDKDKHSTVRIPLSLKMPIGSMASHGSVPGILGTPKSRKKRKLIVSGIPLNDESRFEAVKKWCESFGELNSITRAPSGDLYIDFRKAEVADTVCRLQARVYISGVGSVGLSWFTGKKP
ncbi:hypothetical protein BKA93DRAFT_820244 [Sparassis latifolia]